MKSLIILAIISGLSLLPIIWWLPTYVAFICCLIVIVLQIITFYRLSAHNNLLVKQSYAKKIETKNDSLASFKAIKLADALGDPLVFFYSSGNICFINQAAYQTFTGLKCEQSLFTRFRDPQFLSLCKNVATTGKTSSIDYNDKGRQKRWFQVSIMAINSDLFICHFHDHSQIHHLNRMRSDFVTYASHELRTPLTSLLGFIETLRGPAQNDADARARFLLIMQEQAERMARLINDLLSLSRLETQTTPSQIKSLDITKLLHHVIATLTPVAQKNNVTIELNLFKTLPLLSANRDSLIQLLQNLIENALKYAASGKKITVSAKSNDQNIEIAIRDYGKGIAAEHLPRLTERFYRVNIDESHMHKGTGLGLAIVKHIITQHHGQLKISSKLGEGSVFTVILPINPPT